MFFPDQSNPFGLGGQQASPNANLFGPQQSTLTAGQDFVDPKIDYHNRESHQFSQYLTDTNVRWAMFGAEMATKANIVNSLTKLEEKYQVRG